MRAIALTMATLLSALPAHAADRTRFWNLTANTINSLQLAPAGTTDFGKNQCQNDRDGTVDHDERLRITDIAAGRYDVKFSDTKGRVCIVRNIAVKPGEVFSIEEKQLKGCGK